MPRTVLNSRRSRTSCSAIAMATVLAVGATPAGAKGLNAEGVYVTNSNATGIVHGATTTTINLNDGQTVIDWTPDDNIMNPGVNIDFQTVGTTATFTSSLGDFSVLNRITPADMSRAIAMNGTVNARVGGVQRGNVYFYSPNGFVFGGTSAFSVGSLVVTTSPIQLTSGNFINGPDNTVVFEQTLNPSAQIISNGTISANFQPLGVIPPTNSYVAMVAPRVVHNGAITVNGSAALVAAEAATINFSPDGLFDIQVTAGTTDGEGVNVSGDIGGPTPVDSTDKQGIYLVAVPKNQLMTMVIGNGADLGFTLANTAVDDNGVIVLSAGHNVADGAIGVKSAGHGSGTGSFWFTGAHATSNVFGEATGFAELYSIGPSQPVTTFDNDLTVHAVEHVELSSFGIDTSLSVAGNVGLSTDRTGAAGESLTAGLVQVAAGDGGSLSVGGTTTLSADATGGSASSGTAGSGTGGEIWVNADDGGSLSLLSLTATAQGTGGDGLAAGVHAGQGTGGTVRLYGDDASTVVVNGALSYDAKGTGGDASGAGLAGVGEGGSTYVYIGDDSFVTINGSTTLKSDGQGGSHASGNGGGGFGGEARFTSVVDSLTSGLLTVNGNVELSSDGTGGDSAGAGTGGTGQGGWVRISTPLGSTVDVNGTATLHANGTGGDSEAGTGGLGQGGLAEIAGLVGDLDISGLVTMRANGLGGESQTEGNTAGAGTGGDINISAAAGTSVTFQSHVDARANGDGGATIFGVNGGTGTGGDINVSANGAGGTLTFSQGANLFADGAGSAMIGDCLACGAVGGNGFGGTTTLTGTSGGLIEATGILELSATGNGGAGVTGIAGNGTGGTVLVYAPAGLTIDVTGNLELDASGHGGLSTDIFAAGNGTGNSARVHVDGGTVNVSADLELDADGHGGESEGGGDGGDGTGGRAEILTTGTTALLNVLGNVLIEADGVGGESFNFNEGPLGDGGDGFGGKVRAAADDGKIHITGRLDMDATSTGGAGANGGNATGVTTAVEEDEPAAFLWAGAATAELDVDGVTDVDISATGGSGADGGNGGNASGGEIDLVSQMGKVLLGDLVVNSSADGGAGGFAGGAGGAAVAGDIDVTWALLGGPQNGTISIGTATLSAIGTGGNGGDGFSADTGGDGGDGGNGTGGRVSYVGNAAGGTFTVGATTIIANGDGGDGGNGGSGDTGAGGNGGAGGIGTAGTGIQTGTVSLSGAPGSGGIASFTTLTASASATGGDGGDGGQGGGGTGTGGHGGNAIAGEANFLVRGVPVTAGTVNLFANATGGNGGSGSTAGNGGNATAGFVSVESKDRFGHATQRGSLTATSITGTAIATGGSGANPGTSTLRGGSFFRVLNGDANIGTLSFNFAGGLYDGAGGPNYIQAEDGTGTIGSFTYNTTGELAIYTTSTGSLNVGTLSLTAGNFIDHPTLVGPASPGTIFANSLSVTSGGDFIADANLDVDNGIAITVPGAIRFDNAVTSSFVDLWAQGGSIQIGNANAASSVSLVADSFIDGGNIAAGGAIFGQAFGGNIQLGSLTSTFATIFLDADGNIFLSGDMLADGDIELFADGNIMIDNATSGESITLDAGGYLDEGGGYVDGINLTAGDSIEVHAADWVDLGNLSAGLINPSTDLEADFVAAILAGEDINVGNIAAAQHVGLGTPGAMTTGTIDAGGIFMALGTGNMSFQDATAGSEIYLADFSMMVLGGMITDEFDPAPILASAPTPTGGSITIGAVDTGRFTAAAGTSLTTGAINSDGAIALDAGGAISTSDLVAGDFVLANGGSIMTGNIDANSVEMTSTGGDISTDDIFAFGSVVLDAFGDILTEDITAGSIDLLAGGDITTDNLTTQFLVLLEEGGFTTQLFPGASITLESGGDIATDNIDSIDGVFADAGGALSTGTIDAVDFVQLQAVNNITTLAITAGDYIDIVSTGGAISTQALIADGEIDLDAFGNIGFASANASEDFDFSAGGSVNGGNVVAGTEISGDAAGTVTLGNLTAGLSEGDDFSIGIAAIGNITVQNATGAGQVGFATQGNLQTGNLSAGELVLTMVGGNTTTGSITTASEGFDQVYMADDSMFTTGGGTFDGEGDFDESSVLALDPVATGGSITINGPVNTDLIRAAAGTGFTAQAITAEDIHVSAGGTATVNGDWTASDVELASNDIDITANGSIDASDILALFSTNATQALIGDGLAGSGYALSNAEFGRLEGGSVYILARGDASAAQDMLVGDLSVTGPSVGSTVDSSEGILVFATGDFDGIEGEPGFGGVIRVNGDIAVTGFGSGNAIEFYADRFELDAATGSIAVPGSELGLYADRIHVAEASILNQLATNPTYTNYQQDLNEAAAVQRPEGVLIADTLWIESDNLQGVLVQNTGTAATPAGFLVGQAFINDDFEVAGPPGSINLVVNGQVVTEGGTLTGVAARDALITPEDDITPFTANSTINGCPLTGECIIKPPEPPVADIVDDQIDLIGNDPFGEDNLEDTQEGEEGSNNPISPPQPLFDTRPLIPTGDVNDPVSGTGNPALLGSDQCEKDENGQCLAPPVNGEGQ